MPNKTKAKAKSLAKSKARKSSGQTISARRSLNKTNKGRAAKDKPSILRSGRMDNVQESPPQQTPPFPLTAKSTDALMDEHPDMKPGFETVASKKPTVLAEPSLLENYVTRKELDYKPESLWTKLKNAFVGR